MSKSPTIVETKSVETTGDVSCHSSTTSEPSNILNISNTSNNNITSITIDVREHDLIQLAEKIEKNEKIEVKTAQLPIGDILIQHGDQTLVFERKTIADLSASIKDGRYSEQRQRLKSTYPFHRVTLLIEGNTGMLRTQPMTARISSKTILSALISAQYRDGFHVYHTSTPADTLWYLLQIAERMGEKTHLETECKEEYGASLRVKTQKRENVTPGLCYLLQLSQLPGISMTTATEIAKTYPTMRALLSALTEKGVKAFSEIDGMGPKRAKLFCDYFG
jgi:ERCC4-type nuclease